MHKILFILACTCSFIFILPFSVKAQDSKIIVQIKQTEATLSAMLEKNNVEALDKILHPQFTVQSPNGYLVKKAQLLEKFRNGGNPYVKFRPVADSVIVVNQTTAISSGKEIYVHKKDNKIEQEEERFFYHVWIKYKNKWLLAGRIIASIPDK